MAKGNICEKCQKKPATKRFELTGWRIWNTCEECRQELLTCSKCKKNPATKLIEEKGEKKQFCADCATEDSKCQWCQDPNGNIIRYGDAIAGTKGSYKECELYLCKSCNEAYKDASQKGKVYHECWTCKKKSVGANSILEDDKDEKFNKAGICQDCLSKKGDKPNDKGGNACEKCKQKVQEPLTRVENLRTKQVWNVCNECFKCQECKKNSHTCITNEWDKKWEPNMWLCDDCHKNGKGNKKDKPNDKGKEPKPDEVCERCGASCIVHKTKTSYTIKRKRYIKHKVDFTRESSQWFGLNCGCIEKFKQENRGTCPQCHKTEFPDMSKGWMLDYEIKKAFCKPECHVAYRELTWEKAQRLPQVEIFPPELDIETNPGQNTDWEKEGLKREVLFWREYAKSLEQRLNSQNLTPQERQQTDYLRNLQQNTLRNAESNYQSRYGILNEDGSDKGKGISGGMIFLIIIGILALVGGIIFLLTRNKKSKK